MGDTPGVCTRLQAKQMSLSLVPPEGSSKSSSRQSVTLEKALRSHTKGADKKDMINDVKQYKKSKVVSDSNGDLLNKVRGRGQGAKERSLSRTRSSRADENKNDVGVNNDRMSVKKETRQQNIRKADSSSSDENLVPSSYNTRSSASSPKTKLALSGVRRRTRSVSSNKTTSPSKESQYASRRTSRSRSYSENLEVKSLRGRERKKVMTTPVSEKTNTGSSSEDDVFEASPTKKRKIPAGRKSPRKGNLAEKNDDLSLQESIGISVGSLEKEHVSSEVVDSANKCRVSGALPSASVSNGAEESCITTSESMSPTSISRRVRKSLSLSVTSPQDSGRNSPLENSLSDQIQVNDLHGVTRRFSTEENKDGSASQRSSLKATSKGNELCLQSTPSEKTLVTEIINDDESSKDTFEEIIEKVAEESEMSLNTKIENLATAKNLSSDSSDASSDEVITLVDEDAKKICSKFSTDNHETSLKTGCGIESKVCELDLQCPVPSDVRNKSPEKSQVAFSLSSNYVKKSSGNNISEIITIAERDQFDDKMANTSQASSQSPKNLDKPVLHASSDIDLFSEDSGQHAEKSLLMQESNDEIDVCVASTNNKLKIKQNEKERSERISHDIENVSAINEKTEKRHSSKSVLSKDQVTNLITLDSDVSSEFSVTELEAHLVEQNNQNTIDKNVESEAIEVKSLGDGYEESEEETTGTENDGIEVVEMDVAKKRKITGERSGSENEGPANESDEIVSLQNEVMSDESCLSLHKGNSVGNSSVVKDSIIPKFPHDFGSGKKLSKINMLVTTNKNKHSTSFNSLSGVHGDRKNITVGQTSIIPTWQLSNEAAVHKNNSVVSKQLFLSNLSPEAKRQEDNKMPSSAQQPTKKVKVISAAEKVLQANVDITSSDVEELVNAIEVPKKFQKKGYEIKKNYKSSFNGPKTLPKSVNVKSQVLGKHGLVNTVSKLEESSDSDSDAESRKKIRQKAKMRITKNVAESHSKQATSSGNEDYVVAPESMVVTQSRRPALESQRMIVDSVQHQKRLMKMQRRKRLEMLKQQKEEKLNRLKESMASKEDASCSSSESSAGERQKRDVATSYLHDGFLVSPINKVVQQERIPQKLHVMKKKKKKPLQPAKKVADSEKPAYKATTQWSVEDLLKGSGKLRRLPDSILNQLNTYHPKKSLHSVNSSAKNDEQKRVKRKHWKDTGVNVNGFQVATDVDYIPLETSSAVQFGVVPLDRMMKAAPALAETSSNFRNSMLYGSHIRREPANALFDRQKKLKAGGKAELVKFSGHKGAMQNHRTWNC